MPAAAADAAPAASFTIPLHFDFLASPDAGPAHIDVDALAATPPAALLSLADDPSDPDSFTAAYALVSRYPRLKAAERAGVVEAVRAAAGRAAGEAVACKRAAFLLGGLAQVAEGEADAKKRKAWDKGGREAVLEAARGLLDGVEGGGGWSGGDRDQVAGVLLRMVLLFLESAAAGKDKAARPALARVLGGVLGLDAAQALPANAGMIHLLCRFEHVAAPIAEVVERIVKEGGGGGGGGGGGREKFAGDLLQEIVRLEGALFARDSGCAKACAACIGELAERLPRVVLGNIALLLALLDGDSYTIRNGVLHAVGRLVLAVRDDAGQAATRESLFEILLERGLRDVNAFTRSKALQTWAFLAEARAIPHRLFVAVAGCAASRLEDKAAAVRRAAAQLLCALLQCNPYGPVLSLRAFRKKLGEFGGEPDVAGEGGEERGEEEADKENAMDTENVDGGTDGDGEVLRQKPLVAAAVDEEEMNDAVPSELVVKQLYYKSAVDFIVAVEAGLEKAYKMLRSTSISDVSEAVNLLVLSVQFQLEAAASGRATRAMLALVLAREPNIKAAAIDAYQHLLAPHLDAEGNSALGAGDSKDEALVVANGLVALVVGATTGEVACLEALVEQLMKKEPSIISPAVVAIMWDVYAGKIPGATQEQRSAACIYIGMFAAVRPDTLQSRAQVLEKVGLNPEDTNYLLWTCIALRKLPVASDVDGNICRQLVNLIEGGGCGLAASEQALNALYRLHPAPENDVSALVVRMARVTLHPKAGTSAVSVSYLARFLHLVGHIAIKQLVRVEAMVSQIRKASKKDEEEEAGAEAEKALDFAEAELTLPESLLGQYGLMARAIAADENAPAELRASAVLCLSKLMCVKSTFCEANLQLLFTVLERASEASVRANAITALGDLAFRFPNLVEPWSTRIYAALEDKHVRVRKNALMALTHLILNDMVKVKGQMVGLALRVLDSEERIAELARVFFHELSRKSANAIYNLLPDTISCVSRRRDLSCADVKKVMSFLIGFIDKGWQAEGVVDKLCQRFRTAENEQESRDIAFCIAQLNLNDRCIGRLADSFKLYSAALADDEVHQYLSAAVMKGRKFMATAGTGGGAASRSNASASETGEPVDSRGRADELLQKMERQREKTGEDDDDGDDDK